MAEEARALACPLTVGPSSSPIASVEKLKTRSTVLSGHFSPSAAASSGVWQYQPPSECKCCVADPGLSAALGWASCGA